MPYLSPPTLTRSEVESLLAMTRVHPRDHLIIAIALGTGLWLGVAAKAISTQPGYSPVTEREQKRRAQVRLRVLQHYAQVIRTSARRVRKHRSAFAGPQKGGKLKDMEEQAERR